MIKTEKSYLNEIGLILFMLRLELEEIPQDCGVYLFKGEGGEVLYVGKAKNLRTRINNYFRVGVLQPKIQALLQQAQSWEYFLTTNEKEALLLEATLIKKYKPKYNVLLKDDKNYPMLRLSINESYPALEIVRKRRRGDNAIYFGPFTSARSLKEILKLLSKIFPLRKCSLTELKRRKRPCIYYQIHKCLAPCVYKIPKEEYDNLVRGVIDFFQGRGAQIIDKWRQEMHNLSEKLEFERAAFLRDRIKDLEVLLEKQSVVLSEPKDLDLWDYKKIEEKVYLIVLFIRHGYLYGSQTFSVRVPFLETFSLKNILLQYYLEGKIIPSEILIPEEFEELEEYEKIFSEYAGNYVKIKNFSEESECLHLRNLAQKNLENYIKWEMERSDQDYENIAEALREFLQLERAPYIIEAVDLSQYAGEARVGAIVSFYQGSPDKKKYRHYKIKGKGKDDYSMLREVVYRRLKRGLEEKDLPDLLLIDGGKGHLEVALMTARDLGLSNLSIRSISKDEKRNPDKVYLPGRKNPKILPKHNLLYSFLGKILNEAHRFALSFSQKTLKKLQLQSILDVIPGVGPKRKKVLLHYFKDLSEIINTPTEKIGQLPGFNLSMAKKVKEALVKLISEKPLP